MFVLLEQSPDGDPYWQWLLSGLGWTLALWIVAGVIALAIGIMVGCMRTAPARWLSMLARPYVQVFRNVPLIVQAFVLYFVLPEVLPTSLGNAIKQIDPVWQSFLAAAAAIALYSGAKIAEQVRAGIESLPTGQRQAARALGLTSFQAYRLILVPQALRVILPTLTSEVLSQLKNTSVALTIGLLELTAQAQQINEYTFRTFEIFACTTLIYLVIALVVHQIAHWLERKVKVPGLKGKA